MKYYLVVDVGGSSLKFAVMNSDGEIIKTSTVKTPSTLGKFYQEVEDQFHGFLEYNLQGLALSMPGAVDSETGVIGGASALDYIHGPNIKEHFKNALNVPTELENDANCAALAEVWKGAASDVDDCLFIVSGTGIGGAVVKDKHIHKGKHLHGGEFGIMLADFNYDTKELATWSWIGSTVSVVKNVAKEKGVNSDTLDGKEIFDHYREDPIYEKYVDRFYYVLATGIFNLQYAYDPEKIIIGGAVSIRDDLINEVNERLDYIFEHVKEAKVRPQVLTCQYHNDANILGALYHFLTKNS